jgi:hypothetical protein
MGLRTARGDENAHFRGSEASRGTQALIRDRLGASGRHESSGQSSKSLAVQLGLAWLHTPTRDHGDHRAMPAAHAGKTREPGPRLSIIRGLRSLMREQSHVGGLSRWI